MAKTRITVEHDFDELIKDLLRLAEQFPEVIKESAEVQLEFVERAVQINWFSMVPWAVQGDYVYDSIGYNVEMGDNEKDVVGMVGVFLVDHITAKHGYNIPMIRNGFAKEQIKAPQIAYWVENGYAPFLGAYQMPIPFLSNAYYQTLEYQDELFADTLDRLIKERLHT